MSEYWKSQPKKFCEYCKCWLADNKPSIQAHEFGKRHKDNVAAKISDVQKKGQKDYEDQKKLEADFKRMEKKAALAYEKDLERMHEENVRKLKEEEQTLRKELEEEDAERARQIAEAEQKTAALAASKSQWFEAKSPEGYSYYWHVVTNETVWVAPEEGYVSVEEQAADQQVEESGQSSMSGTETAAVVSVVKEVPKKDSDEVGRVKMKITEPVKVSPSIAAKKIPPKPKKAQAPAPAPSQYWNERLSNAGGWLPAEELETNKKKETDLQLPKVEKPELQVPTLHRLPGVKFREKTTPTSTGSALEAFKKRKLDAERLKYVRSRPDTS